MLFSLCIIPSLGCAALCFTMFQIDFLNSVIVDMQRKNDEMKQRLYAMENGINGADEGYSDR